MDSFGIDDLVIVVQRSHALIPVSLLMAGSTSRCHKGLTFPPPRFDGKDAAISAALAAAASAVRGLAPGSLAGQRPVQLRYVDSEKGNFSKLDLLQRAAQRTSPSALCHWPSQPCSTPAACDPCTQCFSQPMPIYDPSKSRTYTTLPCTGPQCQALPVFSCSPANCHYNYYSYADTTYTDGVLGTEDFTLGAGSDPVAVTGVAFECGTRNKVGADNSNGL
ncbi:aspartic proteinase nepenthesin-1-like [Musa acuminata AAA Group]|uniref:aspartic proteinase nepenthesin-1-like n=1 Tax=Musa acuminata AAA Group TaxID=214697 RepID=UPI0031D41870